MSTIATDIPSLALIDFYLGRLGWSKTPTTRSGIIAYLEPSEQNQLEIFLPTSEQVPGYRSLISDAIRILSYYEDSDEHIIKRSIQSLDYDLHSYRVLKANNSISITLLEGILSSAKQTFKESVKIEQSIFLRTLSNTDRGRENSVRDQVEIFIDNCNFCHTWHGSFGVTLESPLCIPSFGLDFEIPEPLGRKASKRILRGMATINEATELSSSSYLVDKMSANDILIFSSYPLLQEHIQTQSIEYSMTFSPVIENGAELKSSNKFEIRPKTLRLIERAVEQVKQPETEYDTEIIGFPETISAAQDVLLNNVDGERKVTVKGVCRELSSISIKLDLSLEDYKKAIRAQDEAKTVRVGCRIKKKQKGWEAIKLYHFDLIQ